jgi:hypothetical protein
MSEDNTSDAKQLDRWMAGEQDFTPEELEGVERGIADAIDRRVAKKWAIRDMYRAGGMVECTFCLRTFHALPNICVCEECAKQHGVRREYE